ncbi:MAG: hypothetical protein R3301_12330 [Saprospiraceae bacterium]|nr:hypothetical protein [Saprospiraceae bacterium]
MQPGKAFKAFSIDNLDLITDRLSVILLDDPHYREGVPDPFIVLVIDGVLPHDLNETNKIVAFDMLEKSMRER